MDSQVLSKKLLEHLDEIRVQNENILDRAVRSINACRKLLSFYKKEILNNEFKTIKEEIKSSHNGSKRISLRIWRV